MAQSPSLIFHQSLEVNVDSWGEPLDISSFGEIIPTNWTMHVNSETRRNDIGGFLSHRGTPLEDFP